MKLLSDVILVVLILIAVALFLGASGLATKAYSADVQPLSNQGLVECQVHDMTLLSCGIEMDADRRSSLVLELVWDRNMKFPDGELRGTLFIDRSNSPTGCVVACRLDSRKLIQSPMLTVRVPLDGDDSRSGFRDVQDMQVHARFVQRN